MPSQGLDMKILMEVCASTPPELGAWGEANCFEVFDPLKWFVHLGLFFKGLRRTNFFRQLGELGFEKHGIPPQGFSFHHAKFYPQSEELDWFEEISEQLRSNHKKPRLVEAKDSVGGGKGRKTGKRGGRSRVLQPRSAKVNDKDADLHSLVRNLPGINVQHVLNENGKNRLCKISARNVLSLDENYKPRNDSLFCGKVNPFTINNDSSKVLCPYSPPKFYNFFQQGSSSSPDEEVSCLPLSLEWLEPTPMDSQRQLNAF